MATGIDLALKFTTVGKGKAVRDAKDIQKAANQTQAAFKEVEKAARRSGASVREAFGRGRTVTQFGQQIRSLSASARAVGLNTKQLTREFAAFINKMKIGSLTAREKALALARLKGAMAKTRVEINKAGGGIGGFVARMDSMARSMRIIEGPLGGTAARMQTFTAVLKAGNIRMIAMIGTFTLFTVASIKLVGSLFRLELVLAPIRARFNAILGSAKAARTEMLLVSAQARKLGIDFKASATGYSLFLAAAKSANISLIQTREMFKGVSTAASALSLSADDVNGIMRALTQMISKGTVSAEELRGQLGERLPGAFALFATSMSVSTEELGKMMKKGEVLAKDTLPDFLKLLGEINEEGSKLMTLNKRVTDLSAAWEGLQKTMAGKWFQKWADETLRAGAQVLRGAENAWSALSGGTTQTEREAGAVADIKASNAVENFESLAAAMERINKLGPLINPMEKFQLEAFADPTFAGDPTKSTKEFRKAVEARKVLAEKTRLGDLAAARKMPIRRDFGGGAPGATASAKQIKDANTLMEIRRKFEATAVKLSKAEAVYVMQLEQSMKLPYEKYNEELAHLVLLRDKGALSTETFAKAEGALALKLIQTDPILKQLNSSFDELGKGIWDSMGQGKDALESLKNTASKILSDLSDMFLQFAIMNPLKNMFLGVDAFPTLGALAGAAASLFGGDAAGVSGGSVRSPFGNRAGKAGGGDVRAGVAYNVGERGIETFVPGVDGTIVSNQQRKRGGGDVYNIDARGADKDGLRRLETMIVGLNGSIEKRSLAANHEKNTRTLRTRTS